MAPEYNGAMRWNQSVRRRKKISGNYLGAGEYDEVEFPLQEEMSSKNVRTPAETTCRK